MTHQMAGQPEPDAIAAIGPYEEWPALPGDEDLGSLYVGADGMLSRFFREPVPWSSIRRLRLVRIEDPDGFERTNLEADTGVEGLELTLETARTPDSDFHDRVRSIVDRLHAWLAAHGVDESSWPSVE